VKKDVSGLDSTVIRAWADDDDKKIVIQIEDRAGETLAFIRLNPDKASDLSDSIAIQVAQLKKKAKPGRERSLYRGRPALLC
jgi:hypothetical protein